VIDDFAHHPTSIRLAVQALRQRYPDARLWIIFEPRSNTTRRNIFQSELADALASADRAVVPAIADPEKFAEEERLDPEQLVRDIAAGGGQGVYLPTVEEIAGHVAAEAEAGDVVAILSNGGFGGLHGILLERLGDAATGR
jgi:UDP-N-acetylmuramate: L-alanyl-gamma-D-glutamyl-meso-diaminopimelate ligase